jgi:uncharacterized membrane protein
MRHAALIALLLLAVLAACGPANDSTEGAPTPPADAPATAPAPATDFARPINALGTEPFWALKIRPEGLSFSEPGQSDRNEKNPGPKLEGDKATWSGERVQATLTSGVCQDGMSDRSYPFVAVVKTGGKTLNGCAAYADEAAAPAP